MTDRTEDLPDSEGIERVALDDLDGLDPSELDTIDAEGDEPTPDELDELAALAESEAAADEALTSALEEARSALDAQRAETAAAVARYREALLAAAPDVPPDLVAGDSIEAVDASLAAARRTVADIRARIASEPAVQHGFPAGAPARGDGTEPLSAAEKIALGLRSGR